MPPNAGPFIAARDLLLRYRTDYDGAIREFRWPVLDRFNWALDYFDHLPADDLALWCVGEIEEQLTFGQLRTRSNQVANYLRELGVRRGDRVMLLVPNLRQLFEAILGLMKLGAVVSPATTLLTKADIRDRFERGQMRHAIVDAPLTGSFAGLPGDFTRIALCGAPGWLRFEDAYTASETFEPDGETRATDPLVLYFTSGTTAKPKIVRAHASELSDRTAQHRLCRRDRAGGHLLLCRIARMGGAHVRPIWSMERRLGDRRPGTGAIQHQIRYCMHWSGAA